MIARNGDEEKFIFWMPTFYNITKKTLKIPKWIPEAANWRRTDNAMAKSKKTKRQKDKQRFTTHYTLS
jgi:hypothetical protein